MEISNFDELLQAVRIQPAPQRLLFVFTSAQLPEDASEAEKEQFKRREGGALTPVLSVDRLAAEMEDFASLRRDAQKTARQWDVLFVSSITAQDGAAPTIADAEQFMKVMLEAIKQGKVKRFIAFNRAGELLQIAAPGARPAAGAAAPPPAPGNRP